MKKTLISLVFLLLFLYGMGTSAFFPSLLVLKGSHLDLSIFRSQIADKLLSLLLLGLAILGSLGWSSWIGRTFLLERTGSYKTLLGLSIILVLFSIYSWGLAVNGILRGDLVALFFLPSLWEGWKEAKKGSLRWISKDPKLLALFGIPGLLWMAEYLSTPLAWDAVLDHFRYAREVARLHQVPLQWVNHTGDMPKGSEILLAGFWALGGETLSKLSLALPAILTLLLFWEFRPEGKGPGWVGVLLFLTTPFFLAVYSWGYAEGFLALFEVLGFLCFWKGWEKPEEVFWVRLTGFFLGAALSVKYTAVLAIAPILILWILGKEMRKKVPKLDGTTVLLFLLPVLSWFLKNFLAFGNPVYPLATGVFGSSVGYSPELEKGLWADTGRPGTIGLWGVLTNLWDVLFTPRNQVGAAWTPLALMGIPWAFTRIRERPLVLMGGTFFLFLLGWALFCTSLRHLTGGVLVLALLGSLGWQEALRKKGSVARWTFGAGILVSFWLTLSAQCTVTAPYLSALSLEDPLQRLKRHYSFGLETFEAYRFIEGKSRPEDKVLAFAVFQTYPLQRTAFVDLKWKAPIFLQWVNESGSAKELAGKMRREGVEYFLYQKEWAAVFAPRMKGIHWHGMTREEYVRFWRSYMEPLAVIGETLVFKLRKEPVLLPLPESEMPILRELAGK